MKKLTLLTLLIELDNSENELGEGKELINLNTTMQKNIWGGLEMRNDTCSNSMCGGGTNPNCTNGGCTGGNNYACQNTGCGGD